MGVLTRPDAQVVFVDTPGIHKPRTALGTRLNATAQGTIDDVDVVCLVLDATQPVGRGDQWVAGLVPKDAVCVLNKIDKASRQQVLEQLATASSLELSEYFPVSARTGDGVGALVEHLVSRMPEGPQYFPDEMVTDVPEAFWVAELVREQLLARTRDELPHSIAARVTEWDWPFIRCEILVERDSQKGIVIGKGGQVLKEVGTAVREQLPEGAYLELQVKVDKNWQRHPKAMERFGY
jgi:GTP-binding protein Era